MTTPATDPEPQPAPELFSIVQATEDVHTLPIPDAPYYVIDRDSFLVHRRTKFGRVLARLDKPPVTLPEYKFGGFLWPSIPPIPGELLGQVWGFFRSVFTTLRAEAAVLLLMDANNEYSIFVPEQEVDYASVDYKFLADGVPQDKTIVGSIHSHCDFDAFHSGTDETDAGKHDGLHITFGKVTDDQPDIDVMLAFNGIKWKDYKLSDISPSETLSATDFPAEWMDKPKLPPPMPMTMQNPAQAYVKKVLSDNKGWKPPKGNQQTGTRKTRFDDEWDEYDELANYYNNRAEYDADYPKGRYMFGIWPIDEDYASLAERCADEMEHDLELLQKIAAKRGLRIKWQISQRKVSNGILKRSVEDEPPNAKAENFEPSKGYWCSSCKKQQPFGSAHYEHK